MATEMLVDRSLLSEGVPVETMPSSGQSVGAQFLRGRGPRGVVGNSWEGCSSLCQKAWSLGLSYFGASKQKVGALKESTRKEKVAKKPSVFVQVRERIQLSKFAAGMGRF